MNNHTTTTRSSLRGTAIRLIGAFVLLLTLVASLGASPISAQRQSDTSTRGAVPDVIAHGVTAMPSDSVAWRLVEYTAFPIAQARTGQYDAGFAFATNGDLQIQDGETGQRDLVGANAAAFVPDGARQLRASTLDGGGSYVEFALVDADSREDAGDGTLVGNTDGFDAPSQPDGTDGFELALYSGGLYLNQTTTFHTGDQPALLYVTSGTLEASGADGALESGQALSISGDVTLTGQSDDARYAIAIIGRAVPALPTPSPTAKATARPTARPTVSPSRSASPRPSASKALTGNAVVRTYLCPDQPYWATDFSTCVSAKNTNWSAQAATSDFSTQLDMSDATVDRNAAVWTLPKSSEPYAFNVTPPDGYGHVEPVNNAGERSALASPDQSGVAAVSFYFFPYGEQLGNAGGFEWSPVSDDVSLQSFQTPVVFDADGNQVWEPVPVYQGAAGPNFNDLPFGTYTIDITASLDDGNLTATADNATATDTPGVFTVDIEDASHPTVTFTLSSAGNASPSEVPSASASASDNGSQAASGNNSLAILAEVHDSSGAFISSAGHPTVTDENGNELTTDSGTEADGRERYSDLPDGTYTIYLSGLGDGNQLVEVDRADATDDPNIYTVTLAGGEDVEVDIIYQPSAG